MLKETIKDEIVEPVVSDIWRASEVGELCEAYLCHVRLGHQPAKMLGRVRHLLSDGNMHEDDIVRRLKSGGLDVLHTGDEQMYVHCTTGPIRINGHPDGVLHEVPKELRQLDWADENFSWDSAFHLLEITAPNGFAFQRYAKEHLRGVNWRKFVQTHLYLGSVELRDMLHCAVVVVKNKTTSALYEEGLTYDKSIVDMTIEKLKRVEEYAADNCIPPERCDGWFKDNCKFRHLDFTGEEDTPSTAKGYLDANKLLEGPQLREALVQYDLSASHKVMNAEARDFMAEILEQYEAEGIFVDDRKIKWTYSSWSGVDANLLRTKYPAVFKDVYVTKPTQYVSVGRR